MKVHRFIHPHSALETFGPDYVAHAKCGECRYVLRSLGFEQFLILREAGRVRFPHSEQVGGFRIEHGGTGEALQKFIALLARKNVGVHRLIAVDLPAITLN